MPDSNQQTEEMRKDSPKCECGYLKAGLEESAPCPECGSTKIWEGRNPSFFILSLLCASTAILMSAFSCIVICIQPAFTVYLIFLYVCYILPAILITVVLMVVGALRDEKNTMLCALSLIFILASAFVTPAFIIYAFASAPYNYWGQ